MFGPSRWPEPYSVAIQQKHSGDCDCVSIKLHSSFKTSSIGAPCPSISSRCVSDVIAGASFLLPACTAARGVFWRVGRMSKSLRRTETSWRTEHIFTTGTERSDGDIRKIQSVESVAFKTGRPCAKQDRPLADV